MFTYGFIWNRAHLSFCFFVESKYLVVGIPEQEIEASDHRTHLIPWYQVDAKLFLNNVSVFVGSSTSCADGFHLFCAAIS